MPIIRYRTRDLTCLLPGDVGPMRRMARITGRSDDMLIIRGVNVFPSQIEEQVLKCEALAPHYEIEVYKEGNLDCVDIRTELKPGVTDTPESRAAAAKELAHHIKSYIGISTRVEVVETNRLARSEGKAKRVFDRRNQ